MGVVREARGVHDSRVVVHQLAEEPKRVGLAQALWAKIADLNLEALGFVMERANGSIELAFNSLKRVVAQEPRTHGLARGRPQTVKRRAAAKNVWRLVEQHEVQRQV